VYDRQLNFPLVEEGLKEGATLEICPHNLESNLPIRWRARPESLEKITPQYPSSRV